MSSLKNCSDCAASPGTEHHEDCDVARCLATGGQRLMCHMMGDESHDCGNDIWTGTWPGIEDCRRLNLWCYYGPGWDGSRGFTPCEKDHPAAQEDLNRLVSHCNWNAETKQWELPS